MPNLSGKWTQTQVLFNDLGWYKVPGAPTSVSATVANAQSVVSFTAPSDTGQPAGITGYKVTASTGGSIVATATGSASPLTITGLTNFTAYNIEVQAQNAAGYGDVGTTTVTPTEPSQTAYTTAGVYTFVVPSGLNPATISLVAVGGAGGDNSSGGGGGGGGLGYKNNISVTAGTSYSVHVGARSDSNADGGDSYLNYGGTYIGANGGGGPSGSTGGTGGSNFGCDGGGSGGNGGSGSRGGGGGAAGYSGAGGAGGNYNGAGSNGAGGGAGGGYGGIQDGGGGGGTGILGEGSSGAGATTYSGNYGAGGGGGSGGGDGKGAGGSSPTGDGAYGGGAGSGSNRGTNAHGAVRILYSFVGTTRAFPSTNTGDL